MVPERRLQCAGPAPGGAGSSSARRRPPACRLPAHARASLVPLLLPQASTCRGAVPAAAPAAPSTTSGTMSCWGWPRMRTTPPSRRFVWRGRVSWLSGCARKRGAAEASAAGMQPACLTSVGAVHTRLAAMPAAAAATEPRKPCSRPPLPTRAVPTFRRPSPVLCPTAGAPQGGAEAPPGQGRRRGEVQGGGSTWVLGHDVGAGRSGVRPAAASRPCCRVDRRPPDRPLSRAHNKPPRPPPYASLPP